jgi:hypothetical protein
MVSTFYRISGPSLAATIAFFLVLVIDSRVLSAPHDSPGERVAACAALPEGQRLSCYDSIAVSIGHRPNGGGAVVASEPSSSISITGDQPVGDDGGWEISRLPNPLDDTETIVLTLSSDTGRSGFENQPVTLVARCKSNKTELYLNWNTYLGDDSNDVYSDWKYVTLRIGDRQAETQRWGTSTDHEATFAPNWAGNLLKNMLKADYFVAQTTPHSENPVTAEFDIRGLDVALRPLSDACGWSYK